MSVLSAQLTEFWWAFPRWQPPPGNGLVAVVPRAEATRGWVESLLAVDGERQYVWAGLGGWPERQAWEIVERFGVATATLAAAGADARQVYLSLQVAEWLWRKRAVGTASELPASCLTAWSTPAPPPGAVRIPHLVPVRHGLAVADAVVWELIDGATARQNMELPADWEFFESHLATLLWLRAAVRAGRLPATPLAGRLFEVTHACGAELSIEVVYRNADLFRLLLDTWRGAALGGGGANGAT